jgi:ArsR family transcriptional regulator
MAEEMMPEDRYKSEAERCKVLSHPVRLQILNELRRAEACVCHLQAVVGRPQAYVSQQLAVLRDAGVVDTSKDGLNVFYHLADRKIRKVLGILMGEAGDPRPVNGCPCPKCEAKAPAPS